MKRITHTRQLTPAKAVKYRKLRQQVTGDLPELVDRHRQRTLVARRLGPSHSLPLGV